MAIALNLGARHPLFPTLTGGIPNDAAGFASRYGPHLRSPYRALDTGPRPFPDEAASLLPGLLAATRTGLSPASDGELTNSRISRYVTASPPILLGAQSHRYWG
jgi:hypothetical protein